jgi:hypothetical protein
VSVLALVFGFMAPAVARAAGAEPLPTQDDIHQLFDQGKYPVVLQKLQRVLVLKGAAAKPYDRHDLLRLKAETHLRLKAQTAAAQAFAEAADEVGQDTQAGDVDRAMALLVKRSQNFAYTPRAHDKAKPADPLNILEADSRKKALEALFHDEFALAGPKIKAVQDARQLPPIIDIMPTVRDIRVLESAATGSTAETKKVVGDLGTHAHDLMADAVKRLKGPVDDIEKSANEYVRVESVAGDPRTGGIRSDPKWKKKGIDRRDTTDLQNTVATCDKIAAACRDLADVLGDGAADFGGVRTEAGQVARKADQVLNADYKRTYDRPPR